MDWVRHWWPGAGLERKHILDEHMGYQVIQVVAGVLVIAVATATLCQIVGRYLINYRLSNWGVEIVLCNVFRIKRIPFDTILGIQKFSAKDAWTRSLVLEGCVQGWGNRVWGDAVVIRKRMGVFDFVIITPDNASEFADEIVRRMAAKSLGSRSSGAGIAA